MRKLTKDMKNLKEYMEPAFRLVEVRFENALLQASGADRADDGYDPGIDLPSPLMCSTTHV